MATLSVWKLDDPRFTGSSAELIQTNLSEEDEAKLREAFAQE